MIQIKGDTMRMLFFVALAVLLVGCAAGGEEPSRAEWKIGTQALEMNFLEGTPPPVIYDGDPVDISLELWNRGASPLVGDLYLTGFDESIFTGISKRPHPISIQDSRTRYNTEGGYDNFRVSGRLIMPDSSDTFTTNIKAVACYFYETIADVQVCIDPEPNRRDTSTDACQARDVSVGGGQAAPVAVTRVEVEPTPGRTIFRITLRNVGGGTILNENVVDDCLDSNVVFADTNWLYIESVRLGLNDFLQCEPQNPVRVSGGQAVISCVADGLKGTSSYSSVLTIEASYGYREDISQPVQLRSTI